MEDLPLGRIAALVPKFAVKDLPLGRTLMIMIFDITFKVCSDTKVRVGCGKQREATAPIHP